VQGANNAAAALSLTGTDAAQFSLSSTTVPSNLTVGASPSGCPRTYNLNIVATLSGATGSPFTQAETITGSSSSGVTFTALHKYFMAPTNASPAGNDANNGTSAATPWASPNHTGLVCGDVIIAAAGTYPGSDFLFGTPSGCPSTSGGIDGTGGIYFVTILCGSPSVGGCSRTSAGSGTNGAFTIRTSNWAVEGWQGSAPAGSAFIAVSETVATDIYHHIAFINDISFNSNRGIIAADGGTNHNIPGQGIDYWATVGSIGQNSNNDNLCLGAIDSAGPANIDTITGVHTTILGSFGIANLQSYGTSTCNIDGEAFFYDTFNAHGYQGTAIIANNLSFHTTWSGVGIFLNNCTGCNPTTGNLDFEVYNNTTYDADVGNGTSRNIGTSGQMNMQLDTGNPWTINIFNNISRDASANATSPSSGAIYAELVGGANAGTTITLGGAGLQNVFKGLQTTCLGSVCDAGNNVVAFNSYTNLGTNTYTDPLLHNTADLANRFGQPNCSGFETTTQCMGWNPNTQVLTIPSGDTCPSGFTCTTLGGTGTPIIADLTATCGANCAGKGYQLPSATCSGAGSLETNFTGSISGTTLTVGSVTGVPVRKGQLLLGSGVTPNTIITAGAGSSWTVSNSQTVGSESMGATYYPYWLKGMVYLHWDGTTITEKPGLVTKPCGL
jgi:hypothetical protein